MSEPSVSELVAFARGEAAWFRRNRGDVGEQDQCIMTAKANKHDAIAAALERLEQIEASASFEFDELRGWLVMFSHALATGTMEGPRPDEARKLDIVRAHLERLHHVEVEHQGCTENMASLARERDAIKLDRDAENARVRHLEAERDGLEEERDKAFDECHQLERERDEARRELKEAVKEWVCDQCSHVVLPPSDEKPWDLSCPLCGPTKDGVIMPRNRYERVKAEAEAQEWIHRAMAWQVRCDGYPERLEACEKQRDAFAAAWDELRAWADSVQRRAGQIVDPHTVSGHVDGWELASKIDEIDPRAKGSSSAP